jgi:hypothetical protein
VGVMMKLSTFYILFTKGIFLELERNTYYFLLLLCFEIFALLLSFRTNIAFDFLHALLWNVEKTEEKFWQAWRKNKNLGAP